MSTLAELMNKNGSKKSEPAEPAAIEKPKGFILGNLAVTQSAKKNAFAKLAAAKQPHDQPATTLQDQEATNPAVVKGGAVDVTTPMVNASPTAPPITADQYFYKEQVGEYDADIIAKVSENLDILAEMLGDKAIIGQAIYNVCQSMQHHDFMAGLLAPPSYQLMSRGLRNSYGVQIAKKTERVSKKKAAQETVDDAWAILQKAMM